MNTGFLSAAEWPLLPVCNKSKHTKVALSKQYNKIGYFVYSLPLIPDKGRLLQTWDRIVSFRYCRFKISVDRFQFYGAMSLVYLAYGVVWLIVSACQWRELLRIQVNGSMIIPKISAHIGSFT